VSNTAIREGGRDLQSLSKAVSNSYGFNEEVVSVGDIGHINKDQKRSTIVSEDGPRAAEHSDYADMRRAIATAKH
jgi:hypothetical protein